MIRPLAIALVLLLCPAAGAASFNLGPLSLPFPDLTTTPTTAVAAELDAAEQLDALPPIERMPLEPGAELAPPGGPEAMPDGAPPDVTWTYRAADMGREIDDVASIKGLFDDESNAARLLSEQPGYIYRRDALPDPMLIPWRRWEAVAANLLDDANKLLGEGKRDNSAALLQRILSDEKMRGTRVAAAAQLLQERIAAQIVAEKQAAAEARRKAEEAKREAELAAQQATMIQSQPPPAKDLPRSVSEMLKGILWSGSRPMVTMGSEILAAGDTVPGYPEVKIVRIEKSRVTFSLEGKEHVVEVDALAPELTPAPK